MDRISQIPKKYIAFSVLLAWGALIILSGVLRMTTYDVDEGAARALLLDWTVFSNIGKANFSAFIGYPDLRVLLFLPLGVYWPGNILAAKILTIIVTFIGAIIGYKWLEKQNEQEGALIATGIFLIAPFTILQIDHLSVGPFLLTIFGLSYLLDKLYRSYPSAIGAPYFTQCLLVAFAITLHPMGLALPLALLWHWFKNPMDVENKRPQKIYIALGVTTFIIFAMQLGWIEISWMHNPLDSLTTGILAEISNTSIDDSITTFGIIPLILLSIILFKDRAIFLKDVYGSALLFAVIIGLFAADSSWAFIVYFLILFRGVVWLIKLNSLLPASGLVGQRGIVLILIIALSIVFMQVDKSHRFYIESGLLDPVDEVIQALYGYTKKLKPDAKFRVASQWPGRTMLVIKRDTLPLPPNVKNGKELIKITKGLTHIVFNQNDPHNTTLAKNVSEAGDYMKTLAIHRSGVIIQIRQKPGFGLTEQKESARKNSEK